MSELRSPQAWRASFIAAALVCAMAWGAAAADNDNPWFIDVAAQAGIQHRHTNRSFKNPYAEIMQGYTALGAAVAVADYNGDGFEDIFATDSQESGKNWLYRNNGDWTFTEVGQAAGVAAGNDATNASANALWFDYNNDRRLDLLVTRFGYNQLFENLGDGTFKEVAEKAGLTRQYLNSIVAIAFDYDLDGDLDLVLGNYFQPTSLFNPPSPKFFPESFETANNGGGVTLYRNNGDQTRLPTSRTPPACGSPAGPWIWAMPTWITTATTTCMSRRISARTASSSTTATARLPTTPRPPSASTPKRA